MMNREQAIESLKGKLDQWNTDLDRLERRAESFSEERRKELEKTVHQLKDRRDEAMEALDRLGSASDDAFDDIREGAMQAWDSMSDSLEQAQRRFN